MITVRGKQRRLLLCDELSLGLAPVVIRDIYACLRRDHRRGHHRRAGRAGHQPRARRLGALLLLPGGPAGARRADRELRPRRDHRGVFRAVRRAPMQWLNVFIQGSLLGGIYALFAIGLSLSFGIMRLVNIAHGDLIVLSAYVALVVGEGTGLDPLSSLVIVVPVMFAAGLCVAARPVESHAEWRAAAAAAGDLRHLGDHPERTAAGLRRLHPPPATGRDRDREPAAARWHLGRRLSAAGFRGGGARRSAACNFCSTARRSAARFAPPPTMPTPPS